MSKSIRSAIILLLFFIACMCASFYISRYKLVIYPVKGESMEPNVHDEDKVLVYRTQNVKYGDIVILESVAYSETLIKRVIGLGGDVIDIKYNEEIQAYEIWRNNVKLEEEYIKEKIVGNYYTDKQIVVPQGKLYYLGDNRNFSRDSHSDDVMEDTSLIVGKVLLRYKGFDIDFLLSMSV